MKRCLPIILSLLMPVVFLAFLFPFRMGRWHPFYSCDHSRHVEMLKYANGAIKDLRDRAGISKPVHLAELAEDTYESGPAYVTVSSYDFYIFIPHHLLDLQDKEYFIGLLGHEVGHIAAGHLNDDWSKLAWEERLRRQKEADAYGLRLIGRIAMKRYLILRGHFEEIEKYLAELEEIPVSLPHYSK